MNKDSLVRQKEYLTESSSKSRECVQRSGVIQDKSELLIAVWIILIPKG
ncbi:hypothetical protein Taro_054424 [Colocasia esculenta]|uniref:Uncharacterized protein n=1 Tax=Colocasia esculenta TaxID=4460 RepID=A0A843XR26_COLES|nr:hypothetical protein [Colocasia esculenta]